MKHKGLGCTVAFASGLLVASLLPCEFVIIVAAVTIIILAFIFRRRSC